VNLSDLLRGKLYGYAASLIFLLSYEFLYWQYPVAAASENLARLARFFRNISQPAA
jgi:hypothetical protein